jgi:hypothetical protein
MDEMTRDRRMLKFRLFPVLEPCFDEIVTIHAQPDLGVSHVAMQDGVVTLWALCDLYEPKSLRTFRIIGTGHQYEPGGVYLGTVMERVYVWHIFEITQEVTYGL